MEKRALTLQRTIKKHCPKKENLDPRKWMTQENMKGFADFVLDKNSDKETDDSFDSKEMCEYIRTTSLKYCERLRLNCKLKLIISSGLTKFLYKTKHIFTKTQEI